MNLWHGLPARDPGETPEDVTRSILPLPDRRPLGDDSGMGDSRNPALLPTLVAGGLAAAATYYGVKLAVRSKRRLDLAGRVVLLTGGSRGLGLELARQLAGRFARVAILARDEAELREAREDAGAALAIQADVTRSEDCRRAIGQVEAELGPVEILINNAGVIAVGPFESQPTREFEASLDTHVRGPLELIRHVLPGMKSRGIGRIVNVASIGGKVPVPHLSAYVAGKHALVGLTETLRAELVRHNIHVTLVCPGLVRTGSPWQARFTGDAERDFAWFAAGDNLPGLAIDPETLARRIIDALVHGDAELVTPWNAKLATALHGLLGGVSAELASVVASLLPQGDARRTLTGREADEGQLPDPLRRAQARNAGRFNEA
jgi:NAD(P)-dependent dehydrogenase (short-subunit alcohol dehydrogenase family)